MLNSVLRAARVVGMAVVGLAAAAKLWDVPRFEESLRSWVVLPGSMLPIVALTVPAAELALVILFVSPRYRDKAAWTSVALVGVFTLVYAGLLAVGERPECLCMGRMALFEKFRHDALFTIARNAAIMSAIAAPCLGIRRSSPKGPGVDRARDVRSGGVPGFTIIELMVSIGVVGLLLAILLPVLASARAKSREVMAAASIRSAAGLVMQYAADNRDSAMVYARPGEWLPWPGVANSRQKCGYFLINLAWADFLKLRGYIARIGGLFVSPDAPAFDPRNGKPLRGPGMVHYQPSCSFLAGDGFWRRETRTGPEQWRAMALSDARVPSRKVLMTSLFPWAILNDGIPSPKVPVDLAMVDGSAGRFRAVDCANTRVLGDGPRWFRHGAFHVFSDPPGTHTPLDDVDVR